MTSLFLFGLIVGMGLYVLWALKDCNFRVEEGQVAVVTRFGAARHDKHGLALYGPGLHFKWFFEEVLIVSLREQLVTLGGDQGAEVMMLNDGTVIRLHSMLRYEPLREGIARYLFGLRHRKEHVAGLFSSLLRNEVANVKAPAATSDLTTIGDDLGGAYALVRRDRTLLNQRIADFARDELGDEYGVHFEAIDVTDIHPPEELAEALNAVISAKAETDVLRFRAESECAQKVMDAARGVEIASARAEGLEIEIMELGKHLSVLDATGVLDAYVTRRRTEVLSEARTVYLKDNATNGGVR